MQEDPLKAPGGRSIDKKVLFVGGGPVRRDLDDLAETIIQDSIAFVDQSVIVIIVRLILTHRPDRNANRPAGRQEDIIQVVYIIGKIEIGPEVLVIAGVNDRNIAIGDRNGQQRSVIVIIIDGRKASVSGLESNVILPSRYADHF